MERVGDGQVNLATVQALCLLSMNDLAGELSPKVPEFLGQIETLC